MRLHPSQWLRWTTLRALALPMLTITMGQQLLRVLYPSLTWYLGDTRGAAPTTLAVCALAAFTPALLAAALRQWAGPRFALWLTAGGVAAIRLLEQLVDAPSADLWLALAGTVLFVLFLPTWIGHVNAPGLPESTPRLAYGLLLGLALDTAIKGAAGTLDLSWIPGLLPIGVIAAMAVAVLGLLVVEPFHDRSAPAEPSAVKLVVLLALGPYMALQAIVFQNQGWVAAMTGLAMPQAFLVVMGGNVMAAAALTWGLANGFAYRQWLGPALALYIGLAATTASRLAPNFAWVVLVVQAAQGWGWGILAASLSPAVHPGLRRTSMFCAAGLLLFLFVSFFYYAGLEIALPWPRNALLPISGWILGVLIVLAAERKHPVPLPRWKQASGILLAGLLALVAVFHAWVQPAVAVFELPSPLPIRVLTYNIHSAYNVAGRQDPEAIASVIQASGADLVALQEVSRGWMVDGSTDLAGWLSQRLGLPFLFRGTADPVWGNAILSRYPITDYGWAPLPTEGTLLPRGFLWAKVELGEAQPLFFIATHLHHVTEDSAVRQAQVAALLSYWDDHPFSLLAGDLNARPQYAAMLALAQAGWVDSWSQAGEGDGWTWPAAQPFERIDWIWHTSDLVALQADVIATTASDHLPLLVTIGEAR